MKDVEEVRHHLGQSVIGQFVYLLRERIDVAGADIVPLNSND